MLSVEATGKNIEQAIQNALFELKAIREDVDIKILEEGGFFKKAKVLVSISEDAIEKYQSREKKQKDLIEKLEQVEKPKQQLEKQEEVEQTEQTEKTEQAEQAEGDDNDEEIEVLTSQNPQPTKATDVEKAQYFINGIIQKAKLSGTVEVFESDDEVFAKITGASELIGYRGEGLNALQYLTSVMVSKNNRHSKRVKVDCDNYRARREDTLIALAHRMERKVEKSHSSVKLEPMTANERRIIHTALSNSKTVQTESKGTEPHRYLIISPKQN